MSQAELNTSLTDLPRDILFLLFHQLPPVSILSLAQVCKQWQHTFTEERLWKDLFTTFWPLFTPLATPPLAPLPSKKSFFNFKVGKGNDKQSPELKQGLSWRRSFVEHTRLKTPVVLMQTITVTIAGFAGETKPRYSEISTVQNTSEANHSHIVGSSFNMIGFGDAISEVGVFAHRLQEAINRMAIFIRFSPEEIGMLEGKNLEFLFDSKNCPKNYQNMGKTWVVLSNILGITDPAEINHMYRNISLREDAQTVKREPQLRLLEKYYHEHAHPLLYINFFCSYGELAILREIAFEVLRVPAFCACTFGEAVLYSLQIESGIVVDFGTDFNSAQSTVFKQHCNIIKDMTNPQSVLIDYVYKGKHTAMISVPRDDVSATTIAYAIIKRVIESKASKKALQNIIFVGTSPAPSEHIVPIIQQVFSDKKVNIHTPPNCASIIWEGANLFAFTTLTSPAHHTEKFSFPFLNETAKWMTKQVYADKKRDYGLDPCYSNIMTPSQSTKDSGCTIS